MSAFEWVLVGILIAAILAASGLVAWFLYAFTDGFKNWGP